MPSINIVNRVVCGLLHAFDDTTACTLVNIDSKLPHFSPVCKPIKRLLNKDQMIVNDALLTLPSLHNLVSSAKNY
jgi:hypothetical protein